MTVRPDSQRRAMVTFQKTDQADSRDTSVSVDASSIQTTATLDSFTTRDEQAKEKINQTQIIAMMGLDTISSKSGFEDFFNYFTLRNIESELCQATINYHLSQFNLTGGSNNTEDKRFLGQVANQQRIQRAVGNTIYGYHEAQRRMTQGIRPTSEGGGSTFADQFGVANSTARQIMSPLPFFAVFERRLGKIRDYEDAVDQNLGISRMQSFRPTIQYLKLASDFAASFFPRTGPCYYSRPVIDRAVTSGNTLYGYANQAQQTNSEGTIRAAEGGFLEYNINHAKRNARLKCYMTANALTGQNRPLSGFKSHDRSQNLAAMMYVVHRDLEISSHGSIQKAGTIGSVGNRGIATPLSSGENIKIVDAIKAAENNLGEGSRGPCGMLGSLCIPTESYTFIDDKGVSSSDRYAKILSFEHIGVQNSSQRNGRSSRTPKILSFSQFYEKIQGASGGSDTLRRINDERVERASAALRNIGDAARSGITLADIDSNFGVGNAPIRNNFVSLPIVIGDFIESLSRYIDRMMRTLDALNPKNFTEHADENSKVIDRTRFKAAGVNPSDAVASATDPDFTDFRRDAVNTLRTARGPLMEIARKSNEVPNGLGTVSDSDGFSGSLLDNLGQIEDILYDFGSGGNYNAASSGVVHLEAGNTLRSDRTVRDAAKQRTALGLALVLANMSKRNKDDHFYHMLYSRFRFGVFTDITDDFEDLTAGLGQFAYKNASGRAAITTEETGFDSANAEGRVIRMNFSQYHAEGNIPQDKPFIAYSEFMPSSKTKSVDDVRLTGDLDTLGEFFGYIKQDPQRGAKFRVPTSRNSRIFYNITGAGRNDAYLIDEGDADIQDQTRRWVSNDMLAFCKHVKDTGSTNDDYNDENLENFFAITMAGGQAEEYYEVGWAFIGNIVASLLEGMGLELDRLGGLSVKGVTKIGTIGLDTILLILFETLGSIADIFPLNTMFGEDFQGSAGANAKSILIEDVDLRKSINERVGGQGDLFSDFQNASRSNLFLSKSGVHTVSSSTSSLMTAANSLAYTFNGERVEGFNDIVGRILSNLVTRFNQEDAIINRGLRNYGRRHDDETRDNRIIGDLYEREQSQQAGYWHQHLSDFVASARDSLSSAASQVDSNFDVSLIVPNRLNYTMRVGRVEGDFRHTKTTGWLRSISSMLKGSNGSIPQPKFENVRQKVFITLVDEVDESNTVDSHEAMIRYYSACDNFLDGMGVRRTGTINDLYNLLKFMYKADLGRSCSLRGLLAFNYAQIIEQGDINKIIDDYTDTSRGSVLEDLRLVSNQILSTKIPAAYNRFDVTTKARPLRTAIKLSPVGFGTSEVAPVTTSTLRAGTNFEAQEMVKLSSTSEYSSTIAKIVTTYLSSQDHKINDSREVVVAVACPAGGDLRNLAEARAVPLQPGGTRHSRGDRNQGVGETAFTNGKSTLRTFRLTAARDFSSVDTDEEATFSVERNYLIDYFLLPESFEHIEDINSLVGRGNKTFVQSLAEEARWFSVNPQKTSGASNPGRVDVLAPLASYSMDEVKSSSAKSETQKACEDMVESFILKWFVSMTSGVYLDQDLLFDPGSGNNSADFLAPGTTMSAISHLKRKSSAGTESGRPEVLGFSQSILDQLIKEVPIPTNLPVADLNNPNLVIGIGDFFGLTVRAGLVTDGEVTSLITDDFKTDLDPVTGAEVILPVPTEIKPWNIRLTSALMNSFMHRGPNNTTIMQQRPLFDYMMLIRVNEEDLAEMNIGQVDVVSFRASISLGSSTDFLDALEE